MPSDFLKTKFPKKNWSGFIIAFRPSIFFRHHVFRKCPIHQAFKISNQSFAHPVNNNFGNSLFYIINLYW